MREGQIGLPNIGRLSSGRSLFHSFTLISKEEVKHTFLVNQINTKLSSVYTLYKDGFSLECCPGDLGHFVPFLQ